MMYRIALVLLALVLGGCDYVPLTKHKVKTVDGKIITLLCPEIDPHRSRLTYTIDHECRIIIED